MDNSISSSYLEEDNCWDVKLFGEFDIFNSNELKNKLNELANEKNIDLSLDCENLKFMDSTAIGSLVAVLKNVKSYEGSVILRNLKPNLLKLFRITDLDKVFVIEGDTNG